ncbi:MAG: hypothetical protein ACRES9_07110 [Gammaproteobacteria bacterium]
MHFPDFFDSAPTIKMRDPLAEFLGACEGGLLEYHYADVVALAGHSCPTVAVAFLMTRAALHALYANDIPERGGICVEFRDGETAGTTGVIANVAGLITGVTQKNGFKGIGGHFDRRNSLFFDSPMAGEIRFSRLDNDAAVEVTAHLDKVPVNPRVMELLRRCVGGGAEAGEAEEFRRLWQGKVRTFLLDYKDDPDVISVTRVAPVAATVETHGSWN